MGHAEKFYPELHKSDAVYSAGEYYMPSLYAQTALRDWGNSHSNQQVRLLDVGCGKGVFLRDFVNGIRNRWQITNIQATGIDIVRSPNDVFSEICRDFAFIKQDLDDQSLPLPDASQDFICCNHVLEHIFQTEKLIREFRRVLHPKGLCIISVPNIAAWVNRGFFLFGGQPLGTELGTEKTTYGFWPTFMQPRLEKFHPSGHIRDFTPRGLRDLTCNCGFEAVGWWAQSPGLVARLGKWAGRHMGILLRPRANT
jgi:ubiquinone/menaquinone biosynthesis C-methylase UbiE